MSMSSDTIVAPATGMTGAGIGIIRLSGDGALKIASVLFPGLKEMKSHTIRYGFLYDGDEVIDEVMVAFMKEPKSYTREDVVEINCHGGRRVMNRILECLIRNGARLAEPGEFTKRAFLNGRIDLTQAAAVMDIISSKSDFALKSSVRQLRGAVSLAVRRIREEILYQIAYIESALDDPEHYSLDGYSDALCMKIEGIRGDILRLLESADEGRILKEGINTVIIGKPNAGKSSFLNFLLGEERAIVTDIAGTTRDILSESVLVDGIVLNVIDTAGIRSVEDEVEKIGVERAIKYAGEAELIVFIIDSSVGIDENDLRIADLIRGKKVLFLLNKTDLRAKVGDEEIVDIVNRVYPHVDKAVDGIIKVSIKGNKGFDEFSKAVHSMFIKGGLDNHDEVYITNERHKEALYRAYESIDLVRQSLRKNMPEDFLTIDMMSAYESLGKIIGEHVDDDLVNEIFAKFCVGK